jgi:VanZ family protein
LLWAGAITWSSAQPAGTLPVGLAHPLDKAVHFITFAVLGWLLGSGLGRPVWAWVLAATFGAFDELHQSRVPGREADLLDWVADASGALAGVVVAWRPPWRSRR